MVNCRGKGRLKSPVRNTKTGRMRYCKLKKKTRRGRKQDRRKTSGEFHENRYRGQKAGRRK